MRDLIETISELDAWLNDLNHTAQITFRVRTRPRYLVRILKTLRHRRCEPEYNYVQAVGNDLASTLAEAIEAWHTDHAPVDTGRRTVSAVHDSEKKKWDQIERRDKTIADAWEEKP